MGLGGGGKGPPTRVCTTRFVVLATAGLGSSSIKWWLEVGGAWGHGRGHDLFVSEIVLGFDRMHSVLYLSQITAAIIVVLGNEHARINEFGLYNWDLES